MKQYIGSVDEALDYTKDNEYILRGYRIGFHSIKSVLRSLFICHNETANVWSHLIGVFIFMALIVYICTSLGHDLYRPRYELIDKLEELKNDVFDKSYQTCKNYHLEMLKGATGNHAKCMLYNQIYKESIEHWVEEVENKSTEYFHQNINEGWQSLLRHELPKTSASQLLLLEKDPYTELLRQIEYY